MPYLPSPDTRAATPKFKIMTGCDFYVTDICRGGGGEEEGDDDDDDDDYDDNMDIGFSLE
jgi:hypothetical protein